MQGKRKKRKRGRGRVMGKISGLIVEIHIPEIVGYSGSNSFKSKSQNMTKTEYEFSQPFGIHMFCPGMFEFLLQMKFTGPSQESLLRPARLSSQNIFFSEKKFKV